MDDLETVDPRKAEVEDHEIGMAPCREDQDMLAGGCQVDVVASGPEFVPKARRTCGSSSTTRILVTPRP
jgi:hypothetical protein